MNWEKFKSEFHESYHEKIRPFIESKECDKIYAHLKDRSRKGVKIAPNSDLTWRLFQEVSLESIKVIVCAMDPYNKFVNGSPIADGISMSCSVTGKLQPSLEKFYEGIENELYDGLNLNYTKNPDLLYLVKQGIFLINAALTVEQNKPGSHLNIWEPFMAYFFENIVGYKGIPVLFLGKEASKLERYVTPFTHIFHLSHPASASYNSGAWETNNTFKKINQIVYENNKYKLQWLDEECPF